MISDSTKSFLLYLKKINLKKDRAIAVQRISHCCRGSREQSGAASVMYLVQYTAGA
jgi:hypothetical protein